MHGDRCLATTFEHLGRHPGRGALVVGHVGVGVAGGAEVADFHSCASVLQEETKEGFHITTFCTVIL